MLDPKFAHRRVFPIAKNSKTPVIENWQNTAPGEFHFLPHNYGIALDDTDLVIDVDPRNGGADSLDILSKDIGVDLFKLNTPIVRTGGGGFHIFLKKPADLRVVKKRYDLWAGIDFLSSGSFVVGVGSQHANPPHPLYIWLNEVHPDNALLAPESLLNIIAKVYQGTPTGVAIDPEDEKRRIEAYTQYLEHVAPLAVEGHRGDETALKVAMRGRDFGLTQEKVLELMLIYWNLRCLPPWPNYELEIKVRNAYAYAKLSSGNALPESEFDAFGTDNPFSAAIGGLRGADLSPDARTFDPYEADPPVAGEHFASIPYELKHEPKNAKLYLLKYYPDGGMVYDEDLGNFHVWTGTHWAHRPKALMKNHMQRELENTQTSQAAVERTLKAVAARCAVSFQRQATDNLFFHNGVLNLTKGMHLSGHDKRYLNRSTLSYEFRPDAKCPAFLNFLRSAELSPEDILLLQEWFGYILTADTKYQKMLVLIGASRSGKGTIGRVIQGLLGADVCAASLRMLGGRWGLDALLGRKVAILGDQQDVRIDEMSAAKEVVLSVVGNDLQPVEGKHRPFHMANVNTKLMLLCNTFPTLSDSSSALVNRLLILHFRKSFADNEDVDLDSKLRAELPGILVWAIEGRRRLIANNKFTKNDVQSIKQSILDAINPVQAFARNFLLKENRHLVTLADTYERYKIWCSMEGRTPTNRVRFRTSLGQLGLECTRKRIKGFVEPVLVLDGYRLADSIDGVEPVDFVIKELEPAKQSEGCDFDFMGSLLI